MSDRDCHEEDDVDRSVRSAYRPEDIALAAGFEIILIRDRKVEVLTFEWEDEEAPKPYRSGLSLPVAVIGGMIGGLLFWLAEVLLRA